MMCCFGSISRAPLAVMFMVAEMTGSLSILTPALVGVGLAWLIVHHFDDTIYRSQIRSRIRHRRPTHHGGPATVGHDPDGTRHDATPARPRRRRRRCRRLCELCTAAEVPGAPVVDAAGRFEGTISLAELAESSEPKAAVGSLADAGAPAIPMDSRLDTALESIASAHLSWVPVLDDDRHVVATLSVSDLVQAYRRELLASAERVSALGASAGTFELSVTKVSTFAGQQLRSAGFPEGTLVTSIARDGHVLAPTGDVVLEPGDRLWLSAKTLPTCTAVA